MLIKKLQYAMGVVEQLPKRTQKKCAQRVSEFLTEDMMRYCKRHMKKFPVPAEWVRVVCSLRSKLSHHPATQPGLTVEGRNQDVSGSVKKKDASNCDLMERKPCVVS
jgi:hypothetical protein